MKRVGEALTAGMTAAVVLAGCGNGSSGKHDAQTTVSLTVEVDELQLYLRPYDVKDGPGPKGDVLKLGTHVVATCVSIVPNETELSTVRVEAWNAQGYAGLYELHGSKDTSPTPTFDRSLNQISSELPSCSQ